MFVKGLAAKEKRIEGEKEVAEGGSEGCVGAVREVQRVRWKE